MKISTILVSSVATAALSAAGYVHAQKETAFSRVDNVYDWGTSTTKLIVDLGVNVLSGSVQIDSFAVTARRSDTRLEDSVVAEGTLELSAAYVSDEEGNPVNQGQYATLIPVIGPNVPISMALNYTDDPTAGRGLNAWTENEYTITLQNPIGEIDSLVATSMSHYSRDMIDQFEYSSTSYDDDEYGTLDLNYAYFTPEADDGQNPLIVWLHGGGEGGTDPTIPLAANRAAAFASDEVQAHFDGAYVLMPQAPTAWMHGPAGLQAISEKKDAVSIYTRATQDLVENFVAGQPDIDRDRIYLAGASNGGWMAVRLILDYPDYYAAAVPVAQIINLNDVSEDELERIVDVPIWLVTAATDTTVEPEQFSVPLYNKLRLLGAKNLHMSYLERVIDRSGDYVSDDGSPYEYSGHWSWIPTFNNHLAYIEGEGGQLHGSIANSTDSVEGNKVVSLMEWLAAQSR